MRTRRHALSATLALLLALAPGACGEDATGPDTALLTLQIVPSPDTPVAVDSVTVHLDGPTPRRLSADAGERVVIGPLEPGTYDVGMEGWHGGRLAWFSELTVRLDPGEDGERMVVVGRPFAPEEVTAAEEAGGISLRWDAVPAAVEYLVRVSSEAPAPDAFEEVGRTDSTALAVGPLDPGAYVFRVQALNRFGNGGPGVEVGVDVEPDRFVLRVSRTGTGEGAVTSVPAGIDCGPDCEEGFEEGRTVTLTAEAAAGSSFDGWEGGECTGTAACVVTMDRERSVSAAFLRDPVSFPVTVRVEEGGELPVGSVVSEPAGIRCGDGHSRCSAEFPEGEAVVLTHLWPEAYQGQWSGGGTGFGGWSGDCEGFGPCPLRADGPREVAATAAPELYTYHLVPRIGSGEGWLVPGDVRWPLRWNELAHDCTAAIMFNDGANEPNQCSARVAPGARLSFTSPVEGVEWREGCDSVEGNTCHVEVRRENQETWAVWNWRPPEGHRVLEVDYYGGRDGVVRSDVPGIYPQEIIRGRGPYPLECGATGTGPNVFILLQCSQAFPDGTTVTLTATPGPGYEFTGWSGGGCSGVDPCVVVLDQSYKVTPSFAPVGGIP